MSSLQLEYTVLIWISALVYTYWEAGRLFRVGAYSKLGAYSNKYKNFDYFKKVKTIILTY